VTEGNDRSAVVWLYASAAAFIRSVVYESTRDTETTGIA
jgi:hypothetical protein